MPRRLLALLALPLLLLPGEAALAAKAKPPTQKTIQAIPAVHYYTSRRPSPHLTQAHRPHPAHG